MKEDWLVIKIFPGFDPLREDDEVYYENLGKSDAEYKAVSLKLRPWNMFKKYSFAAVPGNYKLHKQL